MFLSNFHYSIFIVFSNFICWASCLTNSSSVRYVNFFYHPDPKNPDSMVELKIGDTQVLKKYGFRPDHFTVICIHGFFVDSLNFKTIRNVFVKSRLPVNVVSMDWSRFTSVTDLIDFVISPIAYVLAAKNIDQLGKEMADFLCFLVEANYADLKKLHIIGHSLGAHLAGAAGRELKKRSGKLVWRITALDPAGPLFEAPIPIASKLGLDDAHFIDAYHSNLGLYGGHGHVGHANFLVNGGSSQPGCNPITNTVLFCSHIYVKVFFALSFNQTFIACSCPQGNKGTALISKGKYRKCLKNCNVPIPSGIYTPTTARGQYVVMGPKVNVLDEIFVDVDISNRTNMILFQRAKMFGLNIDEISLTRSE